MQIVRELHYSSSQTIQMNILVKSSYIVSIICFMAVVFSVLAEDVLLLSIFGTLTFIFSLISFFTAKDKEQKIVSGIFGTTVFVVFTTILAAFYSMTFAFAIVLTFWLAAFAISLHKGHITTIFCMIFILISLIPTITNWYKSEKRDKEIAQQENLNKPNKLFQEDISSWGKYTFEDYRMYKKLEDLYRGFYRVEIARPILCEYLDQLIDKPDLVISVKEIKYSIHSNEQIKKLSSVVRKKITKKQLAPKDNQNSKK